MSRCEALAQIMTAPEAILVLVGYVKELEQRCVFLMEHNESLQEALNDAIKERL